MDDLVFNFHLEAGALGHLTSTSIGFSITIISIQLLTILRNIIDPKYIYILLATGPVLGLIALYNKEKIKIHSGVTNPE